MAAVLVWRLLKFTALTLLAGGAFGVLLAASPVARMRALALASLGMAGTWVAGYALMKRSGLGLDAPWILAAVVASLLSFVALAVRAQGDGRPRWSALGLAGLAAAVTVMVLRSRGFPLAVALTSAATVGGVLGWRLAAADQLEPDPRASWSWFAALAWLEGLSLFVLVPVGVPLRRLTGVSLDGGTGVLGWSHGVLFVLYLVALFSAGRILGWSRARRALGVVAALVPVGTFVFERRVQPGKERAG